MQSWAPFPFIRLTLAWLAGILLSTYVPLSGNSLLLLAGIGTVVLSAMAFLSRRAYIFTWSPWLGLLALSLIAVLGGYRAKQADESLQVSHLLQQQDSISHTLLTLSTQPDLRKQFWRAEAEVEGILTSGGWLKATGKVLLYLPARDSAAAPAFGEQYLVSGSPSTIAGPKNPGEFDYRRYMARKQIYHRYFARSGQYTLAQQAPQGSMQSWLIELRQYGEQVFDQHIGRDRERSILKAMVLGSKSSLDAETKGDYARAGALHILAVSGLHVGIFYTLIVFVLGRWTHLRAGRLLLLVSSVLAIWAYATLTGLAPSVFRAAVMFSFIAVARASGRQHNIYNVLGLSAFCLLLIDPYLLYDVGFQLSYTAVLGIVFGFPRMYTLWQPAHRLVDYAWQLTAVSLAAQLATLPISLHYFGQFPTYFWLSNFLVIPAASLMLLGGLFTLFLSFSDMLSSALAYLLEWVVFIFNEAIALLQWLPANLLTGLYLDGAQSLLLYAAALAGFLLARQRRFRYALYASILLLAALAWQARSHWKTQKQHQLIVHHTRKGLAFQELLGRNSRRWVDAGVANSSELSFQVLAATRDPALPQQTQILDSTITQPWEGGRLFSLTGQEFVTWESKLPARVLRQANSPLPVTTLLLSSRARHTPEEVLAIFEPKLVLFEARFPNYRLAAFTKALDERSIAWHAIGEQGAYTFSLESEKMKEPGYLPHE